MKSQLRSSTAITAVPGLPGQASAERTAWPSLALTHAAVLPHGPGEDGEGDGGEGEPGGESAGDEGEGGGGVDPSDPAVKALIDKAVGEATKGLKSKNDELLKEKKETKAKLDQLHEDLGGEEGLRRLKEQREKLEGDEMGKLLAEGRYDEWFEARSARMREAHGKEVEAVTKERDQAIQDRDQAVADLQNYRVDAALTDAASEARVKPNYIRAIKALVRDRVGFDEDGEMVVYTADGKTQAYGNKGKPMSVEELVESLRDEMGDMFQPNSGGGATGGGKVKGFNGKNPWSQQAFNLTEQARIKRENPDLAQRLQAEAANT